MNSLLKPKSAILMFISASSSRFSAWEKKHRGVRRRGEKERLQKALENLKKSSISFENHFLKMLLGLIFHLLMKCNFLLNYCLSVRIHFGATVESFSSFVCKFLHLYTLIQSRHIPFLIVYAQKHENKTTTAYLQVSVHNVFLVTILHSWHNLYKTINKSDHLSGVWRGEKNHHWKKMIRIRVIK